MRKAQAAMEFMITYGWAILTVIIVIGGLAYFGVITPFDMLPEKCSFQINMNCVDYQVEDGVITLILKNSGGRDIIVRGASASSEALGTGDVATESCSTGAVDVLLKNGEKAEFLLFQPNNFFDCSYRNTGRSKNKYALSLQYSWPDSPAITHELDGELLAKAQSGGPSSSFVACFNAQDSGLCDGLDLVFGVGYKALCCSEQGMCC
jgi:hypothetical protein